MPDFSSAIFKTICERLSPGENRGVLSILIYHRVLAARDPLFPNEITTPAFDRQMAALKAVFNVMPLGAAVSHLEAGTLPRRAACITFDDGYANNATEALPVLRKHGLPATFFIASNFLDGGRMFNDSIIEAVRRTTLPAVHIAGWKIGGLDFSSNRARACAIRQVIARVKYLPPAERDEAVTEICRVLGDEPLPEDLMLTSKQIRTLHRNGMEIGGHTASHPILANLSAEEARREIVAGKQRLEIILGSAVTLFAYPNGIPEVDYHHAHAELVKQAGFRAAVSTRPAAATMDTDRFHLPRFTPWQSEPTGFIVRLMRNIYRSRSNARAVDAA